MNFGSAHSTSLPLYETMLQSVNVPIWEATKRFDKLFKVLDIESDVEAVIILGSGGMAISLEARSPTGEEILKELASRNSFDPCPDGDCDYDSKNICKWCGSPRPTS